MPVLRWQRSWDQAPSRTTALAWPSRCTWCTAHIGRRFDAAGSPPLWPACSRCPSVFPGRGTRLGSLAIVVRQPRSRSTQPWRRASFSSRRHLRHAPALSFETLRVAGAFPCMRRAVRQRWQPTTRARASNRGAPRGFVSQQQGQAPRSRAGVPPSPCHRPHYALSLASASRGFAWMFVRLTIPCLTLFFGTLTDTISASKFRLCAATAVICEAGPGVLSSRRAVVGATFAAVSHGVHAVLRLITFDSATDRGVP